MAKTLVLPGSNIALASRGNFLAARVVWSLLSAGQTVEFDDMDAQLRAALAAGRPLLPAGLSMALEIVAAGVTRAGQPAAKLWTVAADGQVDRHVPDVGNILAPWSGDDAPPVAPDSDAHCLQLARLQARQVRPGAVGGRLIVTTIERGTMTVRDLGAIL
ncbi:MAG: hypothetical protein KF863_10685 [Rubrivivax sp.]|nr:hypothetical protein [Rubrivivax sp.]